MSGLGAVDTQNQAWASDKSKFGYRMLEKMGWREGKGLGAKEDGSTEHVRARKRFTAGGIGAENDATAIWGVPAQVASGLNDVLKGLQPLSAAAAHPDAKSAKVREKKARGFYERRRQGKNVRTYSEMELREIFGGATCAEGQGKQAEKPGETVANLKGEDVEPAHVKLEPSVQIKKERVDEGASRRKKRAKSESGDDLAPRRKKKVKKEPVDDDNPTRKKKARAKRADDTTENHIVAGKDDMAEANIADCAVIVKKKPLDDEVSKCAVKATQGPVDDAPEQIVNVQDEPLSPPSHRDVQVKVEPLENDVPRRKVKVKKEPVEMKVPKRRVSVKVEPVDDEIPSGGVKVKSEPVDVDAPKRKVKVKKEPVDDDVAKRIEGKSVGAEPSRSVKVKVEPMDMEEGTQHGRGQEENERRERKKLRKEKKERKEKLGKKSGIKAEIRKSDKKERKSKKDKTQR